MTLSRELKAGLDSFPSLGLLGSPGALPACLGDSDFFAILTVAPVCLLRCAHLEEPMASHTYFALSFISSTPLVINHPYLLWRSCFARGLPEGFYVEVENEVVTWVECGRHSFTESYLGAVGAVVVSFVCLCFGFE